MGTHDGSEQGGDWGQPVSSQPPAQGDMQRGQQPGPPGQRGHDLADGIGSVDDSSELLSVAMERAKTVFAAMRGPILYAFLAIMGGMLVMALLQGVLSGFFQLMRWGTVGAIISGLISLVLFVLGLGAAAVQGALYRPLHDTVRGRAPAPTSIKEALMQAKPALGSSLIIIVLLGATTSFGTSCCLLPGAVLYICLAPARYFIVGRGMELGEGLNAAIDIGKQYWLLMLGLFVLVLASGVLIGGSVTVFALISAPISGALTGSSHTVMTLVMTTYNLVVLTVMYAMVTIGAVVFWAAEAGVMMAIEEQEYEDIEPA